MSEQNQRIRVLHIMPAFTTGGRERSVLELLKHLDRSRFEAAAVSLFPYSGTIFEREAAEVDVHIFYLSKQVGLDLSILAKLHRVIHAFQPEVVHSHLYIMHYVLPVCVWNRVRVRMHTFGNPLDAVKPTAWQKIVHSTAFHRCGFIPLSISNDIRASIQALYGEVNSPIIYNGTDTTRFTPHSEDRLAWRAEHAIAPQAPVFVTIARFHRQKNHVLLIEAFREVVTQAPQSLLLLVGSGALQPEIEQKVAALGLQDNVRFLGDRRDVEKILNACDVVVSASDWEGLPNNLVEAMAAGKAVIATEVGGVPEVVRHGTTGFLVSPGNREQLTQAMLSLYNDHAMVNWMGNNGRQVAQQKFDIREMAHQYGQLYTDLCTQSLARL